jgi:hypothetical protein
VPSVTAGSVGEVVIDGAAVTTMVMVWVLVGSAAEATVIVALPVGRAEP